MPKEDTQFKAGNTAGKGRPSGARNKLSNAFIEALNDTFQDDGVDSLKKLMEDQPAQYHNIIAKLMPKIMELSGLDGDPIELKWITEVVDASNTNTS